MSNQPTLGQRRVRVSFNLSKNPAVDDMKQRYADIIDNLESFRISLKAVGPENETSEAFQMRCGEAMRSISIAQTEAERACRDAVTALTSEVY